MTEKFKINFKYAFRIHKPLLVLRLIWTWILVAVFGKRPLRYVDTAIGYKCNLSCEHCFARDKKDPRRGRMPPHYFKGVVKQCMKLGVVNFSFQGGEPLLYEDLKLYIKAAQPAKNLISVTTNGTLLTPKKCKELRSWGVDILTISADKYRDNSDLWLSIERAKAAGMNVTIGTTVTHQDIKDWMIDGNDFLQALFLYARQKKIILMLIYAVPMGALQGKDEIMLTPEDVDDIKEFCKKNPYLRTDFQANWVEEGCGAGKEILFINPYGDVYPCPFIDISYGNVRSQSIKQIMGRMSCNKKLKEYSRSCLAGEGKGLWGAF